MNNFGTFTVLRPQSLLRQLSNCSETTCLQALSNQVTWSIYLEEGTITYATHTVEPFDRLERHLRRLSHQIQRVTSETRVQLRLMFETDSPSQFIEEYSELRSQPPEYQAINWLISQGHLNATQATVLIQELVKEVMESFLLIRTGIYQLTDSQHKVTKICRLDVEKVIDYCQLQIQLWQSLSPQISSPYQRPYLLFSNEVHNKNFPDIQPNLTNWMKGFSLRHLAVIINQDEIQLAKSLHPYILKGGIILHEPDPPFDQLPKNLAAMSSSPGLTTALLNRELGDTLVVEVSSDIAQTDADIPGENISHVQELPPISALSRQHNQELTIPNNIHVPPQIVTTATISPKKVYKIVSVDDSPTILKEISRFLETENFTVVAIDDPLKAVMSIIRHKPDLILLDLNMAGIDGYELCRLVRNNSMFRNTPIIFVTGYKGIVDKVKARLAGASGYLTKPFTQAELLKMVFMHLT